MKGQRGAVFLQSYSERNDADGSDQTGQPVLNPSKHTLMWEHNNIPQSIRLTERQKGDDQR